MLNPKFITLVYSIILGTALNNVNNVISIISNRISSSSSSSITMRVMCKTY